VLVLLGVAFLAGLVTALSPCVLPVLPIVLAGSAEGGRRRPLAIVAGLVLSFTVFTLTAASLLNLVGLPEDLLRDLAIVLLFLVGITLLSRRVAFLVERPFLFLTRRRAGREAGGFVLGLSLGLVFVPCAGPVLGAISTVVAREDIGARSVAATLAYALGAGVPMLAIAFGGQRVAAPLRARLPVVRPVLGGVVLVTAAAIALGADSRLQTWIPGYVEAAQEAVERSDPARRELARLRGEGDAAPASREGELADFGPAPQLAGISGWLNSPPLTLAGLRGRVVVVDFWTYSCVNCLRTLPYLKAWDEAYRPDGLTILGVHTPEFAFERVPSNIRSAVERLEIRYPVAFDNGFATWDAFKNQYWPAKYFIDRDGHVRFVHFGEGEYERSEEVIRLLLSETGEAPARTATVRGAEEPSGAPTTPESYLGYERLDRYVGSPVRPDRTTQYRFPEAAIPSSHLSYGGTWRVESERIVAGEGARLRLAYRARDVHLVLGGRGSVQVVVNGRPQRTVRIRDHRLYTLLRGDEVRDALLELRFTPGVEAYAFTFG
jgi:cytochrome c biogenesis protein CcdA/thiol-disulfide isomerase/thioredoxin